MVRYASFPLIFVALFGLSFKLTTIGFLIQSASTLLVISIASWHLAYLLNKFIPDTKVRCLGKGVLISGCDYGFGFETAVLLDQVGFTVFAGCLFPDGKGAQKLRDTCSARLRTLKLDVTSESDIAQVVNEIKLTNIPLWGLVNNAGVGDSFFTEGGKGIQIHRKVFEVNVFGAVSLTKQCLPLLRMSKGRIVNIASVLGRFTTSDGIPYSMSKHAIRSFSDGLRREVERFGVKVVCLEPNMFKTNISHPEDFSATLDRCWSETPEEVKEAYGDMRVVYQKGRVAFSRASSPRLHQVTNAIHDALVDSDPEPFLWCGSTTDHLWFSVLIHLPARIQDTLLTPKLMRLFFHFMKRFRSSKAVVQ